MPTSKAVLAVAALALAGCSGSSSTTPGSSPPDAAPVVLTAAERGDFLERVAGLGFTCRDAVRDDPAYVACTRPGSGAEAGLDTVRLTSAPDGTLLRVSYCGPDPEVGAAFSGAFLGEIGSPDLRDDVPRVTGTPLTECVTPTGTGFVAGGPVAARLPEPELAVLRDRLGAAGWRCRDDPGDRLDCTRGPDDTRAVVSGTVGELVVAAPDPAALAAATTDLGLDREVVAAAAACDPSTTCDHLVVDGSDVTFDPDARYARMRVRAASWR